MADVIIEGGGVDPDIDFLVLMVHISPSLVHMTTKYSDTSVVNQVLREYDVPSQVNASPSLLQPNARYIGKKTNFF